MKTQPVDEKEGPRFILKTEVLFAVANEKQLLNLKSITPAFYIERPLVLFLVYEREYEHAQKRRIVFGGNRSITIKIVPDSDVYVYVVGLDGSLFAQEPLVFNEKGTAKIGNVLDKYGIAWEPVEKETWDRLRYSWTIWTNSSEYIWSYQNGFYKHYNYWTDYNLWVGGAVVYLKNGPVKDDKRLIRFLISGSEDPDKKWELEQDVFDFIKRILEEGCSIEEFDAFLESRKEDYQTDCLFAPLHG